MQTLILSHLSLFALGGLLIHLTVSAKAYRSGFQKGWIECRNARNQSLALADGEIPEVNTELSSRMIGSKVCRSMKALVRMPQDVSRN